MTKPTRKPRVALVGPVLPFRGGIAQYTTELHKALREQTELTTVSFKRQYPGWLYPGQGDTEPGLEGYREPGVDYIIDVYAPLSLNRAVKKIVASGCELAIFDWWTLFWQPGFAFMSRGLRKKGVKTAFLCHNLFDHDAAGLKRNVSEKLLRQADGYIVHASEQAELLKLINPQAKVLERLHPIYEQFPKAAKKLPKRGRLELLFFGFIRPYKGLDVLLEALAELDDKEVYLTIVGEPWGKPDELRQKIAGLKLTNVELRLQYVDDKEAANYFERADVVVLPYLSATGSGVVTIAYNYGRPALATSVGGLADAVIDGRTGWLVAPGSAGELATAIAKIKRADLADMRPAIKDFCRANSWSAMATAISDFARQI